MEYDFSAMHILKLPADKNEEIPAATRRLDLISIAERLDSSFIIGIILRNLQMN